MIDSHAHITYPDYDEVGGAAGLLDRARENGVNEVICIAYDLPSCEDVFALAQERENVYAVVGMHPHEADRATPAHAARVEEMAADPKVVGIGEAGLDYFREYAKRENQMHWFHESMKLSARVQKPVVIHDREAHDDVVAVLKEHADAIPGGVMHCFSGDRALMDAILPLGFYVSIPGTITFGKKEGPLHEVVKNCPRDRLLIETDCPFLTPAPHRGKRNEPAYVRFVLEKIAAILDEDPAEIDRITTANTRRLFPLGN